MVAVAGETRDRVEAGEDDGLHVIEGEEEEDSSFHEGFKRSAFFSFPQTHFSLL